MEDLLRNSEVNVARIHELFKDLTGQPWPRRIVWHWYEKKNKLVGLTERNLVIKYFIESLSDIETRKAEIIRLYYGINVSVLYIKEIGWRLSLEPGIVEQTRIEALKETWAKVYQKFLQTSIDEFEISVRAYNCFMASKLNTLKQVLEKGPKGLLGIRNFGRKSLQEVEEMLKGHGLSWPEEVDNNEKK